MALAQFALVSATFPEKSQTNSMTIPTTGRETIKMLVIQSEIEIRSELDWMGCVVVSIPIFIENYKKNCFHKNVKII